MPLPCLTKCKKKKNTTETNNISNKREAEKKNWFGKFIINFRCHFPWYSFFPCASSLFSPAFVWLTWNCVYTSAYQYVNGWMRWQSWQSWHCICSIRYSLKVLAAVLSLRFFSPPLKISKIKFIWHIYNDGKLVSSFNQITKLLTLSRRWSEINREIIKFISTKSHGISHLSPNTFAMRSFAILQWQINLIWHTPGCFFFLFLPNCLSRIDGIHVYGNDDQFCRLDFKLIELTLRLASVKCHIIPRIEFFYCMKQRRKSKTKIWKNFTRFLQIFFDRNKNRKNWA